MLINPPLLSHFEGDPKPLTVGCGPDCCGKVTARWVVLNFNERGSQGRGEKLSQRKVEKQRRYPLNPILSLSLELVFPARCHVRSHMTSR